MSKSPQILDSIWFNDIGIVKVLTVNQEIKFYIGKTKLGNNQEQDEQHIAEWGMTVPPKLLFEFGLIFKDNK